MIDYELFREIVKESFKSYLPEQFQKMKLVVQPVKKVNSTLDAVNLFETGTGQNISPTIYVNAMYEHYKDCNDLEEAMRNGARQMAKLMGIRSVVPKLDFADAKDNIVFQLVNTEQNRDMLAELPHREFQDLSVIYRWIVGKDEQGIQSAIVNNGLAENFHLNEEQLFKLAAENTKRIMSPDIISMDVIFRQMMVGEGMPEDFAEGIIGTPLPETDMWVISNKRRQYGAASILYEDKLHELAEQLGSDLYILPSSIHEVIAIPASEKKPDELAQMVEEVNMTEVVLEERLSNQVYYYDKELRKVTLASDTPNKRLDGMASEQPMNYQTQPSR